MSEVIIPTKNTISTTKIPKHTPNDQIGTIVVVDQNIPPHQSQSSSEESLNPPGAIQSIQFPEQYDELYRQFQHVQQRNGIPSNHNSHTRHSYGTIPFHYTPFNMIYSTNHTQQPLYNTNGNINIQSHLTNFNNNNRRVTNHHQNNLNESLLSLAQHLEYEQLSNSMVLDDLSMTFDVDYELVSNAPLYSQIIPQDEQQHQQHNQHESNIMVDDQNMNEFGHSNVNQYQQQQHKPTRPIQNDNIQPIIPSFQFSIPHTSPYSEPDVNDQQITTTSTTSTTRNNNNNIINTINNYSIPTITTQYYTRTIPLGYTSTFDFLQQQQQQKANESIDIDETLEYDFIHYYEIDPYNKRSWRDSYMFYNENFIIPTFTQIFPTCNVTIQNYSLSNIGNWVITATIDLVAITGWYLSTYWKQYSPVVSAAVTKQLEDVGIEIPTTHNITQNTTEYTLYYDPVLTDSDFDD